MYPPSDVPHSPVDAQRQRVASFNALLAWSITYQVPLTAVLEADAAARGGQLLRWVVTGWWLWPTSAVVRFAYRFVSGTERTAAAWQPGMALAPLLRQRLGEWLPTTYVTEVADAEQRGTLAAELPRLSAVLRDPYHGGVPLRGTLSVAGLRLMALFLPMTVLVIFNLPKLYKTHADLGAPSSMAAEQPALSMTGITVSAPDREAWLARPSDEQRHEGAWRSGARAWNGVMNVVLGYGGGIVLLPIGVPIFLPGYLIDEYGRSLPDWMTRNGVVPDWVIPLMLVVLYETLLALVVLTLWSRGRRWVRRRAWVPSLRDRLLWPVPWVGATLRQQRMLDGLTVLRAAMAGGQDWPVALARQAEVFPVAWYRRRCRQAAAAVRAGERWDVAWRRARLTPPALDWVVVAGATREEPAATLATLESLLRAQFDAAMRRAARQIELATTLVGALMVGSTAYLIFGLLRSMYETAIAWNG